MVKRIQPGFRTNVVEFDFDSLEQDAHSIYGLSAQLTFVYFNPAWFAFAREHGGEPDISERFGLGTPVSVVLKGPMKQFVLGGYNRALTTVDTWEYEYQCSSPDRFRLYHQMVYPFRDHSGLLVVNSLVEERAHETGGWRITDPDEKVYRDEQTGLISQCINCRRFQRVAASEYWDWIPVWVEQTPAGTSGSLCQPCYQYFWSKRQEEGPG